MTEPREFTVRECTKCGELTFKKTHLHRGWDGWLQTEFRENVPTVERKAIIVEEEE